MYRTHAPRARPPPLSNAPSHALWGALTAEIHLPDRRHQSHQGAERSEAAVFFDGRPGRWGGRRGGSTSARPSCCSPCPYCHRRCCHRCRGARGPGGHRQGRGRPKVLSQLDFAIRIARGLSGLPMPLFGKRKVGRPEKVGEPAAKKKRAMAGKVVKSTPERRKQRDLERVAAYSSVKKKDRGAAGEGGGGGVASREYPNNRIEAGKGLPIERLDSNRGLQHHRPRDMRVNMMARENDHRCQVCAAVGPLWKRGTRFRGGTKKPRRAILMCGQPGCLRNFCSAACFNWWHVGHEFAPTGMELQSDESSDSDDGGEGSEEDDGGESSEGGLPELLESSEEDDGGESSEEDDHGAGSASGQSTNTSDD